MFERFCLLIITIKINKTLTMKQVIIIVLGIIFLAVSCNKESGETNLKKVMSSSQIDTTILIVDTLHLTLGTFDKQEGITIVKGPSHAKLFEVPTNSQEKRDLEYIPQDNYLGVDSILLITKQTNFGSDSSVKLDSALFVIRVLKNDFHKALIGKWYLSQFCGGFMGTCETIGYGERKMEFGYNMDYIETVKDSIVKKSEYYLTDSLGYQYAVVNDISYSNKKVKKYFKYYTSYLAENLGEGSYIFLPFKNN